MWLQRTAFCLFGDASYRRALLNYRPIPGNGPNTCAHQYHAHTGHQPNAPSPGRSLLGDQPLCLEPIGLEEAEFPLLQLSSGEIIEFVPFAHRILLFAGTARAAIAC